MTKKNNNQKTRSTQYNKGVYFFVAVLNNIDHLLQQFSEAKKKCTLTNKTEQLYPQMKILQTETNQYLARVFLVGEDGGGCGGLCFQLCHHHHHHHQSFNHEGC